MALYFASLLSGPVFRGALGPFLAPFWHIGTFGTKMCDHECPFPPQNKNTAQDVRRNFGSKVDQTPQTTGAAGQWLEWYCHFGKIQ